MNSRSMRCTALLTVLAIATPIGVAHAAGDAQRGETKSTPCQVCHGPEGNSENPAFPRLAGQHADYIAQALEQYADGRRQNAIMQAQAATLSKQDRLDLGAYYASREGLEVLRGQR